MSQIHLDVVKKVRFDKTVWTVFAGRDMTVANCSFEDDDTLSPAEFASEICRSAQDAVNKVLEKE